jgi:nitroimidazol reductase NimA-like FMN-containing flavoprotein (pyridoxamine 5'-phosphate oxidase superfamily)
MFGNLTEREIEEVIASQLVGRIGCHADDMTYVVPISYAYEDGCLYAHTREGMKVSMMRKNPKVCFQTDHLEDMANWKSVVAWGEFEELNDPGERMIALQKLLHRNLPLISSETVHLSPHWPFEPEDAAGIVGIIYRIRLTEKTGRFENSSSMAFFAS